MTTKRFEVEITFSQKMIIEADDELFNEQRLNELLGTEKQLSQHVAEVAGMYSVKKSAGVYGNYGLVCVDGETGGKMMRHIAPDSGVNVLPIFDDESSKLFSVKELGEVRRAKLANARS